MTNFTFDPETGEILETYKNGKIYKGKIGFIESQRDFIMECIQTKVTPNIENSKWDVAFYNFLLNSDEPGKRIDQYFNKKEEIKATSKREVARALGWEILIP